MSGPRERELIRRLSEADPDEPPAGLLERLQAEIPARLPALPGSAEPVGPASRPAAERREPSRRWLVAATLAAVLGGSWLAFQQRQHAPLPAADGYRKTAVGPEAPPAPESAAGGIAPSPPTEAAPKPSPGPPAESAAAPVPEPQPLQLPALPPPAPPAMADRGPEGAVEGGVVGGIAGGSPGGTPAFEEPKPRSQPEAKDDAMRQSPAPALQRERDAPPRIGEPPAGAGAARGNAAAEPELRAEEQAADSLTEKTAAPIAPIVAIAAAAPEAVAGRFDAGPAPLAGDGLAISAEAVPSPLTPGSYWLRVEVRSRAAAAGEPRSAPAKEGVDGVARGVELTVERGGPRVAGLRPLGGAERLSVTRSWYGGAAVPGGARWLSFYRLREGRNTGGPLARLSLRYRELPDGKEKSLQRTIDAVGVAASFEAASPALRLSALAAELAQALRHPERRTLAEIARLAGRLAQGSPSKPVAAKADELAAAALQAAASAPR
jgi:hypothetical protein